MRKFKLFDCGGFEQNQIITYFIMMVKSDVDLFSHQFSPKGRAGGLHMLRY
jgi:hypothetical protein